MFIFDSHHASIIWQGRNFCIIFLGGSGGDTIFVGFSGSTWSPATFGRNHIIPVIVLCIIMLQDGGHTQKGNAEEKGSKGGYEYPAASLESLLFSPFAAYGSFHKAMWLMSIVNGGTRNVDDLPLLFGDPRLVYITKDCEKSEQDQQTTATVQ